MLLDVVKRINLSRASNTRYLEINRQTPSIGTVHINTYFSSDVNAGFFKIVSNSFLAIWSTGLSGVGFVNNGLTPN